MAITSRQSSNQPFVPKKLVIISTCVVNGGHIKERGQDYTPASEEETYNLIRAQRAVEFNDPDAVILRKEIEEEKKSQVKKP